MPSNGDEPGAWRAFTSRRWRCVRAALCLLLVCCGASGDGSERSPLSTFPRKTVAGIELTASTATERLPLAGCPDDRRNSPDSSACLQAVRVLRVRATRISNMAELDVPLDSGASEGNFLLWPIGVRADDAIRLVALRVADGVSAVRLRDAANLVSDIVRPVDRMAVLAAAGGSVTVEGLSAEGAVIATCPDGGLVVDGVGYACTPPTERPTTTSYR